MDFYVIPPLNHLNLMHKGDRYFCLAQLYKKDAAYREFFKDRVRAGKWVTLDNGAGDHDIVTIDDLFSIMLDLQPSEVIPPDYLFDGIKTIRALEEFISSMNYAQKNAIQIFGCPQGRNKEEWLFVYEYMLTHPNVHTIGLSKIAVPKAFLNATNDQLIAESRHLCYDTLRAKGLIQKPIHLLGMGNPQEMLYYKGDPLIRSTDSCNSVWSAMNGLQWEKETADQFKRIPTPKDYFERWMNPTQYDDALSNIEWFRKLLGEK